MRITLSKTTHRLHGEMGWDTRFQALLSTRYTASVVLHDRECWLEQFTADRITDPKVSAFARDRIEVVADPEMPVTGAAVAIELTDGRQLIVRREVPKGDADDPLTVEELIGKFQRAAAGVLRESDAARALDLLLSVEELSSVDDLMAVLSMTDAAVVADAIRM
jgi:2-methylcitrate dehydratase PrpD